MKFFPFSLNRFVLCKIPSAYLSGVRVKTVSEDSVVVVVRHRWINQNPFKSMYWATQGMASELATGILLMREIVATKKNISPLVVQQRGVFHKKARGKITFTAHSSASLQAAVQKTLGSEEGAQFWCSVEGQDESGAVVASFEYQWRLKLKTPTV